MDTDTGNAGHLGRGSRHRHRVATDARSRDRRRPRLVARRAEPRVHDVPHRPRDRVAVGLRVGARVAALRNAAPQHGDAPDQPGAAAPTSLAPARIPEGVAVDDWTRDGQYLIVRTFGQAVFAVPLTGERTAQMLVDTPFVEDQSQVSPDGRWIAFNSDESGRWEVYVARVSRVHRQAAGVERRRDAAAVAPRRRGAVLSRARRNDDGRRRSTAATAQSARGAARPRTDAGRCSALRARCFRRT